METTLFRCAECGYRADVLGASRRDAQVKHKSMVCRPCKAVVVTVVARVVPGEAGPGKPGDQWRPVAATCPLCQGGGLLPWPPTHPCPRCGSEMDED